jgi:hypothetical protein
MPGQPFPEWPNTAIPAATIRLRSQHSLRPAATHVPGQAPPTRPAPAR